MFDSAQIAVVEHYDDNHNNDDGGDHTDETDIAEILHEDQDPIQAEINND